MRELSRIIGFCIPVTVTLCVSLFSSQLIAQDSVNDKGGPKTADINKDENDTLVDLSAEQEETPALQNEQTFSEADAIRQAMDKVSQDPALAEDIKSKAQEFLLSALKDIERRQKASQRIEQLQQSAASASKRKEAAQALLDNPPESLSAEVHEGSTADEIAKVVKKIEGELLSLNQQLKMIQEEISNRKLESKELPARIAELEGTKDSVLQADDGDSKINPVVSESMALASQASQAAVEVDIQLCRQKMITYEAEVNVLPLEEEVVRREIENKTKVLEKATNLSSDKRKTDVVAQIASFRSEVQGADAAIRKQLEVSLKHLESWPDYIVQSHRMKDELLNLVEESRSLEEDYKKTKQLIETDKSISSGLSRSVGSLLQRKQIMLAKKSLLLAGSHAQAISLDNAQEKLADIDTRLEEIAQDVEDVGLSLIPPVIQSEKKLLQAMSADIDRSLVDTLIPLGVRYETFARMIKEYDATISKNLLWVRADKPFRLHDVQSIWSISDWFETKRLKSIFVSFSNGVAAQPILAAVLLITIILVIVLNRWFVIQITAIGATINGSNAMKLRPTLQAIGCTICAALPVWLPIQVFSWFLGGRADPESTSVFVAQAAATAGLVFLPLEMLRQLIRPHGVAVVHFNWPSPVINPLRQAVRRTAWIGLSMVFVTHFLLLQRSIHTELSSLARLSFAGLMLFVAFLLARLLHPQRGVSAALLAYRPHGPVAQLIWLWRPLIVAIPIALIGLSFAGYTYAAIQLTVALYETIWSIVAAAVLQGIAMRWLLVSKRRIARQQLRERAELREHAEASGTTSDVLDVNQMQLSEIDQQTRRLINAIIIIGTVIVVYWIWSPVLPALLFLDSVVLWELRAPDGTVTSVVTLNNLLIAIPTLLLTFILVRNAPGVLEAAVLRHLPLDNAARYAVTSLTTYTVAICGIILAAGILGLRWSSVQWMAAGLSVGLGFGLQEVVANFVCGIILLFEQPIRVGDVVTVDSISGVVSRIRMRATTVTTWDRQEYVIPNKDLITGRVTNWTLSDSVNRAELRVGVAYGTDTRRVCELLREICSDIQYILKDPKPVITFEEFADSTLNIAIRFYLANLDHRLGTISEIHTRIHERFNEEGIEIAFPQMDVHMKNETAH